MKIPEKAEKTSKKRGLKAFLTVLFAAVLIAGAVELFCESALIFNSDRGIHELSSERLYFSESGEGPVFDTSGLYTDKIVFELGGESYDASGNRYPVENESMELSVHIKYEGDEDFTTFYDSQPAFLSTEVINVFDHGEQGLFDKKSADEVRIDIESVPAGADASDEEYSGRDLSGIYISKAYVKNVPEFNIYRAFTVFCASFLLIGAAVFSGVLIKNPHIAFFFICVLSGLAMTAALPQNKVGNDEETHLQAVMDMAGIPGELHISHTILNSLMVTEYNDPDYQPGTREEMELFDSWLSGTGDYKAGENTPDFYTMPGRMPAYAFMALFVKLAKGLSLSWPAVFLAGRLGNLLLYTALMFLAVRRTPVGKYLLLLIALFPENVFLACTYSYDPFITGCLSLGTAAFLRELFRREGTADWKNVCLMLLAFFLGCLPKAVYAPLLLMALLLPAAGFRRKGGSLLYRLAVAGLFCMLLATFILPTVLAPAETGDLRGGATSEVSQVGYILSNPVDYALVLISQMIRWIPQCFFGPDCTTFMGHLVSGYTEFKGYWPVYLLLLAAVVLLGGDRPEDGEEASSARAFRLPERAWILLTAGASAVLIWTSMYVAFTEPGAREIAGVQGRYFIPLMYPLYLLPAHRGKLVRVPDICYHLIVGILAGALALTVWTTVLSRFCL